MWNKSKENGKTNIIYFDRNEHRTFNKKRIAGLIILIIILLLFIVGYIVYVNNEDFRNFMDINILRKQISENNLSSIQLEDYDKSNIFAYYDKIAVLKDNILSLYNTSGRLEGELKVQISTPITYSDGRYFIIAQQDSSKAYLIKDNQIVWEKDLEGNISRVNINSAGYSAIVLSGTAYKSVIVVLDSQGNELFRNYLSNTIAVDSALSEDNQYLSFAEVNISGTLVQSNIKVLSIEKAKTSPSDAIIYTYNADSGSLIIDINYQNNNKLVCMYDNSVHIIKNNSDTKVADFNNQMTFYSIGLRNHLVETVESSSGLLDTQTSVQIINMDNQKQKTYNFNGVTKEIYTYGNKIALNLGSEVHFIDTNGWLIKKYTSSQEIRKIVITDEIAGIVYRDKIEIVNL